MDCCNRPPQEGCYRNNSHARMPRMWNRISHDDVTKRTFDETLDRIPAKDGMRCGNGDGKRPLLLRDEEFRRLDDRPSGRNHVINKQRITSFHRPNKIVLLRLLSV